MNIRSRLAAAPVLAALTLPALAASAAPATAAAPASAVSDPTHAQAAVPPVQHRSVFARYRPLADVAPIPWREANETVNRIGGWRAYAREAAAPEPAASASAPASPQTTPPATSPAATPAPRPQEHRHGR